MREESAERNGLQRRINLRFTAKDLGLSLGHDSAEIFKNQLKQAYWVVGCSG